ncbi:hypothetical protein Tco_1575367 [Tanacetum coccineum]
MAPLDHRLNPLFSIKECMTCGALYTVDFCCSKGGLKDKILVPKPPQNCATCGNPVDGLNCRSCAFVRKCLNDGWYTIHDENKILNSYEPSDDNTNVVSASREPLVVNQDPGVNSAQSPLQSYHNCCYKCGDSLDDIFCQRCTCKSCGNGAHIGYNYPPKAPIISNPEQCNQTINELPQTLPSVHPTCNYEDTNSFTYDSKPNFVDDSPNVFNPPPQPSLNSCEFCGNDARYGHSCTPQKEEKRRIAEDQAAKDQYWKIPICYDDDEDYTIAITPVLSTKEAVDSLIWKDEHLDTIPATESDEVIKSRVENLVPIPSKFKGIFEDTCDVPVCEDPSTFDDLSNHSEILSDFRTSSDDDSYENIEYVDATPPNSELVILEEVEDVILCDKLSNVYLLISKIEIEPDQGGLTGIVIYDNNPLLELPEFESFHFDLDPSFPRPPPEPPDVEISLIIETDAPVINNFDELNEDECFDPGGDEIDVEDDDSFTFVIRTFLSFLTYPEVSPILFSTRSEDIIFDPDIST